VAGYYGSDSAGTFVTCVGVLTAANIGRAAYMPVMLAVMEIPGCLVALFLVSRLRRNGMDAAGNMPDELGYDPNNHNHETDAGGEVGAHAHAAGSNGHGGGGGGSGGGHGGTQVAVRAKKIAVASSAQESHVEEDAKGFASFINWELLHEVFLNPGLYLLFGGIFIGYLSRLQGLKVTKDDDLLFVDLFQGALCLFLLEMGMTACKRLRDLKTAGAPFIAFALIAPNIFATAGIFVAHGYSMFLGQPFAIGTYALFSVLCAAASYIAVPAVQRLAIPEASPTLPLAASLGLTFSYNVTIGIPVYIMIATAVTTAWPVVSSVAN
jgi:hypothetical protein